MKVGELKKILDQYPDDREVVCCVSKPVDRCRAENRCNCARRPADNAIDRAGVRAFGKSAASRRTASTAAKYQIQGAGMMALALWNNAKLKGKLLK
jgi:hypothetical protein